MGFRDIDLWPAKFGEVTEHDPTRYDRRELLIRGLTVGAAAIISYPYASQAIEYTRLWSEAADQRQVNKRISEENGALLVAAMFREGPHAELQPDNEWSHPPNRPDLAVFRDYGEAIDYFDEHHPSADPGSMYTGANSGYLRRDWKVFGEAPEPVYHIDEYSPLPSFVELGPNESHLIELPDTPMSPQRMLVALATKLDGQTDDVGVRMGGGMAEARNTGLSEVRVHMLPIEPEDA